MDIAGLIPVVGELADGANGLIYTAKGDMLNAGLSFSAMIPVVGVASTGGKLAVKGSKAVEEAQDASKAVDNVENGISKSEYKNLRRKTPNNEIRNMVNLDGPKVDPIYGYEVDRFEADHIVSMKEITEIDGFSRLSKEQQIEILNLKDNFVGLGKSTNSSKGAYSWADWKGHSKMGDVPINVRIQMLELEEQARDALKVAIEERLK